MERADEEDAKEGGWREGGREVGVLEVGGRVMKVEATGTKPSQTEEARKASSRRRKRDIFFLREEGEERRRRFIECVSGRVLRKVEGATHSVLFF